MSNQQTPSTASKEVRRLIEAIAILPISLWARLAGQAVTPFLAETTGISQSRIHQGDVDLIHPTTIARGREKAIESLLRIKAKNLWVSEADFERLCSSRHTTSSGRAALWTAWVESLIPFDQFHLSHAIATARSTDELLAGLADAAKAADLDSFNAALTTFSQLGTEGPEGTGLNCVPVSDFVEAIANASTWEEVLTALNMTFEKVIWEVFAALDAESGAQYFSAIEQRPLLLFVAPRINPNWDINDPKSSKRNRLFRPTRRMLELMHAVISCHRTGQWPKFSAGRKEFAQVCSWDETTIGNFFDGTKQMSLNDCRVLWEAMSVGTEYQPKGTDNIPAFPVPLAAIAICLEATLVKVTKQHKLRQFILIDEEDYKRRWECHRRQLAKPKHQGGGLWPDWLTNQSLPSEFVRSSQSSGRSSSPRDCQNSS